MLAKIGEIFSSDRHIFEVKWDGIRSLVLVDRAEVRMFSRRQRPMRVRYPEFDFLDRLPPGVVIDAEVVVMSPAGTPDFGLALRREQVRQAPRALTLSKQHPALFVAFDLVYEDFVSIADRPLVERRARLATLIERTDHPRFVFSEEIEGDGPTILDEVCARGLEGVVAKRRDSRYAPGKRPDSWIKIKRGHVLQCVVMGYQQTGRDLKSLIIATNDESGALRCIGKVGSGLTDELRQDLLARLRSITCKLPIVPTALPGRWVEPQIFCNVGFLEWTSHGELRAPVFRGLIE